MSDKSDDAFQLTPSLVLIDSMPKQYQARFKDALSLMHNLLGETLTWQEIAERCAISPYHFHRQFSQLFDETPGHYLGRIRLQFSVEQLLENNKLSITDIAHIVGFSSSQAMAKVLKREINTTAKAIRALGHEGTPEQISNFLSLLATPGKLLQTEYELANRMKYEMEWMAERKLNINEKVEWDWLQELERQGEDAINTVSITPVSQLDNSLKDIKTYMGSWLKQPNCPSKHVAEGYYLTCQVLISSAVAYDAAWEGMFQYTQVNNLLIDETGDCIETIIGFDTSTIESVVVMFQVPILR